VRYHILDADAACIEYACYQAIGEKVAIFAIAPNVVDVGEGQVHILDFQADFEGIFVCLIEIAVALEDEKNTVKTHALDGVDFALIVGLIPIAETDVLLHTIRIRLRHHKVKRLGIDVEKTYMESYYMSAHCYADKKAAKTVIMLHRQQIMHR
jgi:hypothetical protein